MNRHHHAIMRGGTSRIARIIALTLLLGASTLTLAVPVPVRAGATMPNLGTAGSFGVLAGSAVTNTGPTTVDGDVGVSPGTAVSGFPPGLASGTIHAGDAVAAQAQNNANTAYNNAAGQACDFDLTGQNLGGLTLIPGVYCFASSAQLTGQLTLDGGPNSVFIFKIGSTLTTASNAEVSVINGAQPCNIFWQVGSSATLGTNTTFEGNILALTSITLNTGSSTETGLYALNGAVTLDTNDIHACDFVAAPTSTSTAAVTVTATRTALPPTNTTIPVATATREPRPTHIPPDDTPEPTDTVDVPVDTAVPGTATTETTGNTATSTVMLPTNTPSDSGTATNTPTNTITLSTPEATLTSTPLSTQTPGGPSATPTATMPGDTPTQTLVTQTPVSPTETATPPAATSTEKPPVAPPTTPETTGPVGPSPPLFLPPTGGGLPWLSPLSLLVSALLLAVGLGMHRLLRARGES